MQNKILKNVSDIRAAHENLEVHLIDHLDFNRLSVCFCDLEKKFINNLEFRISDRRGNIGTLLPLCDEYGLLWMNQGNITISNELPEKEYYSGTYLGTVTPEKYFDYHRWLLEKWMPNNSIFSIFTTGSTAKSFIENSLEFMEIDAKILTPPLSKTYRLNYDRRELVDWMKEKQLIEIYYQNIPSELIDLEDYFNFTREHHTIYTYEMSGGALRYWKIYKPSIKIDYQRIEIKRLKLDQPVAIKSLQLVQGENTPAALEASLVPSTDSTNNQAIIVMILIFFLVIMVIAVIVVVYYIYRPKIMVEPVVLIT